MPATGRSPIGLATLVLVMTGCTEGGPTVDPRLDLFIVEQIDGGPTDSGLVPDAAPDAAPAPAPGEHAFDHLLEVDVRLPAADWDALRYQSRGFAQVVRPGCLEAPVPSPFTWFEAEVSVDGRRFDRVGVRKKGFIGSLSTTHPSLKVHFEKFGGAERFDGMKRLTLNNNRQDPAKIRQCLSYTLFRRLGVPAPRCGFARVTINGEDLGIYTHVDSLKRPFIRQHFADDGGDLYEGTLSDFRDGWTGTFQKKTNEEAPGRPLVDDLVAAASTDDAELMAALTARLDLDGFFRFWAGEAVTAHWDGYASNANNFYVYDDPRSGRGHFIPWGADGTFRVHAPGQPRAVRAVGWLARRLYLHPEGRRRYLATLELALGALDPAALGAEIDRYDALIGPHVLSAGYAEAREEVRAFIAAQGEQIRAELADGPPPWRDPPRGAPCQPSVGRLEWTFEAAWGSHPGGDPFRLGEGRVTWAERALDEQRSGAVAGIEPQGGAAGSGILMGAVIDGDRPLIIRVQLAPTLVAPGTHPVDDGAVAVQIIRLPPEQGQQPELLGLGYAGALELTDVGRSPGAAIRGRLQVDLVRMPRRR